ncbi:hypothetical protein D3C81_1889030 [compost metagenome]
MSGDMKFASRAINDFCAKDIEVIDNPGYIAFITGNRISGEQYGISGTDTHLSVTRIRQTG